jgi:hypothetical protein
LCDQNKASDNKRSFSPHMEIPLSVKHIIVSSFADIYKKITDSGK